MFLRKLGKRGVAMTEYAILLAFVAAIGGSFASDNGLAASVTDAIGKAKDAINLVMSDKRNLLDNWVVSNNSWEKGNLFKPNTTHSEDRLHTDPFAIEPNTDYEIKVDLNKISLREGASLQLGFMTADNEGKCTTNSVGIDSGWIDLSKSSDQLSNKGYICTYDSATNTATISFTSKDNNTKLAMNFKAVEKGNDNSNAIAVKGVADQLKDAITMNKK